MKKNLIKKVVARKKPQRGQKGQNIAIAALSSIAGIGMTYLFQNKKEITNKINLNLKNRKDNQTSSDDQDETMIEQKQAL